jgi:hypothetical protein
VGGGGGVTGVVVGVVATGGLRGFGVGGLTLGRVRGFGLARSGATRATVSG